MLFLDSSRKLHAQFCSCFVSRTYVGGREVRQEGGDGEKVKGGWETDSREEEGVVYIVFQLRS